MTTLLRIRRLVRSRLGVPVNDRFFSDDKLDDAINLAVDVIETEQRWPWQERLDTPTIASGSDTIEMPDDWRATRAVFVGDNELPYVSPTDLLVRPENAQGRPEVWSLINDQVSIRPFASGDYEIKHMYYRAASDLVDDDDEADMPSQYTGAIVAKACELLSIREDDRAGAGAHLAEYATWLARMRREVRRSTGPIRVRVREGSWV